MHGRSSTMVSMVPRMLTFSNLSENFNDTSWIFFSIAKRNKMVDSGEYFSVEICFYNGEWNGSRRECGVGLFLTATGKSALLTWEMVFDKLLI